MKRYQYKWVEKIRCQTEQHFNELGSEGWQLVSTDARLGEDQRYYLFIREIVPDSGSDD